MVDHVHVIDRDTTKYAVSAGGWFHQGQECDHLLGSMESGANSRAAFWARASFVRPSVETKR